ncbi:MAG: GTP-binding protein, partial [Oscillospiraceae bacterium]|nr:GTP-binding protein [Oscillospiraceae bacterium]
FDTFSLERKRGITIFSKQATFNYNDSSFTIIDTPGHVDFVAEAERTIPVLDFAVLVISGTDGVQPHTETLWNLLERYQIPTVIFITKMDMSLNERSFLLSDLKTHMSEACVLVEDSIDSQNTIEEIATQDPLLMESYLTHNTLDPHEIVNAFYNRTFFPVVFGSGLKVEGISELLSMFYYFRKPAHQNDLFGARVYKITHDVKGNRLTHVRILGGNIKNRDSITYHSLKGNEITEKITGIRQYNSDKYTNLDIANTSEVVALTGLSETYAGQGLGDIDDIQAFMEPVLRYELKPLGGMEPRTVFQTLLELQEEEPQLRLSWDSVKNTIYVHLMGNIQIEVLKSLIWEKYKIEVEVSNSQVLYKETISSISEGIGHFEPLRHYAEVHLLLEPGENGSGLSFGSVLPTDRLGSTWQNLILYHLQEKKHVGVLGGFPLTDVKITLVAGRISLKHTEGGDIREAALRALRQGLMTAKNTLLEPYFNYKLIIPSSAVGRAVNDIQMMSGSFDIHALENDFSMLTGYAPVSEMQYYSSEVAAYTAGYGKLTCISGGYRPCHNQEEVLSAINYDPEADIANTPDSVFCKRGAGFTVKWYDVPNYMHIDSFLKPPKNDDPKVKHNKVNLDEKALEELMLREFGPIRRKQYGTPSVIHKAENEKENEDPQKNSHIIIDGYNLMFLMIEKGMIPSGSLDLSRSGMLNILSNYGAYAGV